MDKEKQIEEMAEDIRLIKELQASNIYTPNYQEAMALISLGYQKCKDKVVLSKEEYEALLLEQKRLIEMADRIPCGYVLKEEARKETAKEICEMGEGIYELSYRKSDAMPRLVAWIKSNFGVETKE